MGDLIRIFSRKTRATPDDDLSFVGNPPRKYFDSHDVSEAHVSVTFTWDIPMAEKIADRLARWGIPVDIGGPAYGDRMGDFTPGVYIKNGYTFTSRGCPKECWFCSVWECSRGTVKELPIKDGWIVCDDNILATSREHFSAVIEMLKRQPDRPRFVGGLEQSFLTPWHARKLKEANTKQLYCAYDTLDDYEPLVSAGRILRDAGFLDSHSLGCYVLIGYPGDSFSEAEKRLLQTIAAGFMPFAMLYRDKTGKVDTEWRAFQREWASPFIVGAKMKGYKGVV